MSHACPAKWTGRTAFVRGVMLFSSARASRLSVSGSQSTNVGRAPMCSTTAAVAVKVMGLVITSSPGPTPSASSAR